MATYRYQPTRYYSTIGSHEPVLHIAGGDIVHTSTIDGWGYDAKGNQAGPRGNPMTGPFYVDAAEPGDTLAVRFDRITPSRVTGFSMSVLAPNVVEPGAVADLPMQAPTADWRMDLPSRAAVLVEPGTKLGAFTLPLAPMLGCFGVAPPNGQAISTATSGEHGGNMDYRGFGEGVTAYLPVFVRGALFHLGDGHAVQGDGEILGTGIETSMDVQFTAHLLKQQHIGWPRGENGSYIFTVGIARPLDQALQHATTEMYRWLLHDHALDPHAACLLLGHCAEYEVGNIVDPAYTMVCKLPRRYLP
jgi:amidase